jgi:hypothetical protein
MFNKDAFSNGQIDSKLWLCRKLEDLCWNSNLTHIYGGWYGVTAFLLLSRDFPVKRICSFDVDPSCEPIADMINENWVIKEWQFKAFTADCNSQLPEGIPDLIINTSTEHFESSAWFDNIPEGTRVALQGNNLVHDDHFGNAKDLTEFKEKYKLTKVVYEGTLDFNYPDWNFTRYMIIGYK